MMAVITGATTMKRHPLFGVQIMPPRPSLETARNNLENLRSVIGDGPVETGLARLAEHGVPEPKAMLLRARSGSTHGTGVTLDLAKYSLANAIGVKDRLHAESILLTEIIDAKSAWYGTIGTPCFDTQPPLSDYTASGLVELIASASERIALRTRRGHATAVCVSPYVLDWLSKSKQFYRVGRDAVDKSVLTRVGALAIRDAVALDVFTTYDSFVTGQPHPWPKDHPIILGYHGPDEADVGGVVCVGQSVQVLLSHPEPNGAALDWSDYYEIINVKPG